MAEGSFVAAPRNPYKRIGCQESFNVLRVGDTHNFGQRVSVQESGFVQKPRPILWEWLILSSCSETRKFYDELFRREYGKSPFDLYPSSLKFKFQSIAAGEVELCPSPHADVENMEEEEAYLVGMNVALMTWLGIDDLHSENIIAGRGASGQLMFFPIDIETIFQNLALPGQTLLLPSKNLSRDRCGFASFLKRCNWASGSLAALCSGYWQGLTTLQRVHTDVDKDLGNELLAACERRVRVILRPSQEYYNVMQSMEFGSRSQFLPAELEQMERGDIPYFFVESGDTNLKYFMGPEKVGSVSVDDTELRKPIDRILGISNYWLNRRTDMREIGVLQLARTLFPLVQTGKHSQFRSLGIEQDDIFFFVSVEGRVLKAKAIGA